MITKFSRRFYDLFEDESRYLVMSGGGGSGKSEFAARKVVWRCLQEGWHRFLVLRKVRVTLNDSVMKVIRTILNENNIRYHEDKSRRVISFFSPDGRKNEILFEGLDDREKLKSIKGVTGIWMEETTEFSKDDFIQIDLRLREMTGHYKQIMMSFNPDEALAPWLKDMFFDNIREDATVHESTVEDNPIGEMRAEYTRILDNLDDPTYFKIYREGSWAHAHGIIYDWDVVELPTDVVFDEVFLGGDFGYSVDPAATVKIYRKALEFWIEEIVYERGLTNQELADKIIADERVDIECPSYWDSSEPKSIEELKRKGLNALPATKGADSVKAGIDLLKSVNVHIVKGSQNVINERKTYKWKTDRLGNSLPQPVKFDDHSMDASRYGIYTHYLKYLVGYRRGKVYSKIKALPVDERDPHMLELERTEKIARSMERFKLPPDFDGKLPIERARELAQQAYQQNGAVDIRSIVLSAEVEEIVVRNALREIGLNEIDGTGVFGKYAPGTQGVSHVRRKGKVFANF